MVGARVTRVEHLTAAPRPIACTPCGCHHAAAVPTYDYQCRNCGKTIEVVHSMLEDGPSACPFCGGGMRRVLHPTGIIFRGSGFYKTDSRSSSSGSVGGSKASTKPAKDAGTGGSSNGSGGSKPAKSEPASGTGTSSD